MIQIFVLTVGISFVVSALLGFYASKNESFARSYNNPQNKFMYSTLRIIVTAVLAALIYYIGNGIV